MRRLPFLLVLLTACAEAPAAQPPSSAVARPVPTGAELAARLGCGACHAGVQTAVAASPLPTADPARDPAAIYAYLLDPPSPAEGSARMPVFRLTEAEAAALALNLAAGRPGSGGGEARALRAALRADDRITAEAGARIRVALGCDACHGAAPLAAAPPLARAGGRLRADWLRAFLARPVAVRPVGWPPGSGTRMPDFRLTPAEVDSLAAWLLTDTPADDPPPTPLSSRLRDNTRTLMRERWGCMGCHAWNGQGGRIGPDLAQAATRLRPSHIRAMLEDPARGAPGTVMPRPLLEPEAVDRIIATLAHGDAAAETTTEPVTGLAASPEIPAGGDAAATYARLCASCHGQDGRGGWNAAFLRAPPAMHADSAAMSARPDDTLFDGIHAGGRILGGSGDMPAFGGSLDARTIRGLVAHIRTLCRCTGPAWSR